MLVDQGVLVSDGASDMRRRTYWVGGGSESSRDSETEDDSEDGDVEDLKAQLRDLLGSDTCTCAEVGTKYMRETGERLADVARSVAGMSAQALLEDMVESGSLHTDLDDHMARRTYWSTEW